MNNAATLACALGVSLLLAASALAQASEPQASDPQAEQAFALLEQGMQHADAGRWSEALALFEKARAVAPYPNVHFQIARAHHALAHSAQAKAALDEYERGAGPHNPNQVEAKRLQAQLAGPRPAALGTTSALHEESDDPQSRSFPIGPVVTMAAGGAALVAALTTGLLTNASEGELERNCNSDRVCDSRLEEVKDRGESLKLATNVLLVAGSAAVGGGLLWWLLSDGEPEQQGVQAALACTHDGCLGDVTVGF